jgi:hypothetical protein
VELVTVFLAAEPPCGTEVSTWTKARFLTAAFLSDACYFAYAAIQQLRKKPQIHPFSSRISAMSGARSSLHWWEGNLQQPLEASGYKCVPAVSLIVLVNQVTEDLIDFVTFFEGARMRAWCFYSESHNGQGTEVGFGGLRSVRKRHNSPPFHF